MQNFHYDQWPFLECETSMLSLSIQSVVWFSKKRKIPQIAYLNELKKKVKIKIPINFHTNRPMWFVLLGFYSTFLSV